MVDTEDAVLAERSLERLFDLDARCEVVAERLLDRDARVLMREAGTFQMAAKKSGETAR
jgi:hypothetical protein